MAERPGRRRLVPAHEAMSLCARAMDDLAAEDGAREDVRTIYLVAGQLLAARLATPHVQVDDRLYIPAWLHANYSPNQHQQPDSEEGK